VLSLPRRWPERLLVAAGASLCIALFGSYFVIASLRR
jgi:hypothetical protein